MTVWRISLTALAALMVGLGAAAQTDDGDRSATAPPRSLNGPAPDHGCTLWMANSAIARL